MWIGTEQGPGEEAAQKPPGSYGLAWYEPCKAVADRVFGLVLLVILAPVMLVSMALVKLTSKGPAIYSQVRVGLNGRKFAIYKIRTMAHDCERHSGPQWSTAGDPRITPIGRFLRRTHLDEFPQLWNVLRGEMSLVGPRPERPEIIRGLELAIPHYRRRLAVRPGVTGLAQVQLPPDTDLTSVERKLRYDLYYVQKVGLGLDLRILLMTALSLAGIPFSVSCSLVRVPGSEVVEEAYKDISAEFDTIPQFQAV